MADYRITGLRSAIDGFQCLRKWSIGLRTTDTVAACSSSDRAVIRGSGNKDWGGVAVGYGLPPKYPGDKFTFTGSARNGQGWVSGTNGAIVSKVRIICPITQGRYLYYQLWFEGTGTLAKGAYSASDSGTPNPLSSAGLAFHVDSTARYGVEAWQFEINGNLTAPSWPGHMAGWPTRDPGNWDATVAWMQTFDEMNQLLTENTAYNFKMYVDLTRFYEVQWGVYSQLEVDYEIEGDPPGQPDYVRHNSLAKYTGYSNSVKGYIHKPGAVAIWPT